MNRVDRIFADLRGNGRKALMPFVCGGHPSPNLLPRLLPALARAGASIVEIGFPFSDPIADGPIIAAAMHDALQHGATPAGLLAEVAEARRMLDSESLDLGLVAMVSVSIVHRMGGPRKFVADCAAAGFDGFIFPDAPLEESGELLAAAKDKGLTASLLIAPTTPLKRAETIAKTSTGFLYLLLRSGITGEREDVPDVTGRVAKLREFGPLPIACGFGVSKPEHVAAIVRPGATNGADAAIVGSALVRRLSQAKHENQDPVGVATQFTQLLAGGLVSQASREGLAASASGA